MANEQIDLTKDLEQLKQGFITVKNELSKVIVGQDDVVSKMLIALLSGGHCLLLGVPGLAKTLLVHSLGQVLDLGFSRVQFTVITSYSIHYTKLYEL